MSDTFKCSCCEGTYQKGWTDEEAREEFAQKYPDDQLEKSGIVCEDCVHIVDAAAAGASPDEIERLLRIRMAEMEMDALTGKVN